MALKRLVLSLMFIALSACSSSLAVPTLEGTHWWLESMANAPEQAPPAVPTIAFTGDRASGRSGCNHWTAHYEFDGRNFAFKQPAVTAMACAYGMQWEQKFLGALRQTRRATVNDGVLILRDEADQQLLLFKRAAMQPPG